MSDTPTYYGPVGETSSDILLEKTFLASGYLTGIGFGMYFVVQAHIMRLILFQVSSSSYMLNASRFCGSASVTLFRPGSSFHI